MAKRADDRSNDPGALAVIAAGLLLLGGSVLACQSAPDPEPIAVSSITPGQNERVVDHVLILLDTSGSIDEQDQFPQVRALLQSFVRSMPEGSYEVSVISFGGVDRQVHDPSGFDRALLGAYVEQVDYLSDGTPLHTVLAEAQVHLAGKRSRASVIVITDGLPSDVIGREIPVELALSAARDLQRSYAGDLCLHTLQIGSDPDGAAFLGELAETTGCGSSRAAATLDTAATIQGFGRDSLFTSDSLPAVAVAGPRLGIDGDRDGVADYGDACLATPAGTIVDDNGCWISPSPHFEFNSTTFEPGSEEGLEDVVIPMLEENPALRLRIAGYTDASGDPNFNLYLSKLRADAVREVLIAKGIADDRIETEGHGSEQPIAPNDSAEGRRTNRRTELTLVR